MEREATVRAGLSTGDLTPGVGVDLGGYPYFDRANRGVHDPLHGGALFLDDGNTRVIVIATDLFWLTRGQADAVRARASERTGVAASNIVVTCSHTHSAPWMNAIFEPFPGQEPFETKISEEYVEFAVETCARLADDAASTPFEAEIGYGSVDCGAEAGIGGNRRDPEGPTDASVPVLVVRDRDRRVRGIWTKYALHPTILHGENTLVSADFPGAMRAEVGDSYPEAVFLYSMGAAGDQSPRYFRRGQTFDEVERFGRTLGRAVVAAVQQAEWLDGPRLAAASATLELPVKDYPAPEALLGRVDALRAREAELVAADAPYVERQNANLALLGAECDYFNAVKKSDGRLQARYDACAPFSVTAMTVGDVAWVFLPGEIFIDFALDIVERSPFARTTVVTLTNGDLPGYCVTREALAEGGYEPGNSILDPAAGTLLADMAHDLLGSITDSREAA